MTQIKETAPQNVQIILVGNKNDLEDKRVVKKEQGEAVAQKYNIPFFETSAFNGNNIDDAFKKLAENVLDNMDVTD